MKSPKRIACMFVLTLVVGVTLFLFAVNTGSLKVSPIELFKGLFVAYDSNVATIFDLRFPRIFVACLGGAATAVAGVLLQAAIRNPLADPGIIGISAGASFATALVLAFAPALFVLAPLVAFVGGLCAFAVVYSLSWKSGLSALRIVLIGVAVQLMLSGVLSAFTTIMGGQRQGVQAMVEANITLKTWSDVTTLFIYSALGLILALCMCKACDLLQLDDKVSRSLGFDVDANRLVVSCIAVLLASISTAIVGPISFLGLIVPHIARMLVGTKHKVLIPFSMLLGAVCLLLADTIGRTIVTPYEISAAVVLAVVCGPIFILMLRKGSYRYANS